eukprot:scaffold3630_cov306-Prasinococcus_capsulatus_cf.AAC.4
MVASTGSVAAVAIAHRIALTAPGLAGDGCRAGEGGQLAHRRSRQRRIWSADGVRTACTTGGEPAAARVRRTPPARRG